MMLGLDWRGMARRLRVTRERPDISRSTTRPAGSAQLPECDAYLLAKPFLDTEILRSISRIERAGSTSL